MPRNERKPVTSVTVVSKIDEACAGSWLMRVRAMGMIAPTKHHGGGDDERTPQRVTP